MALLPGLHAAEISLTELDGGRKRLSMGIGDTLRVTLPSNPSTGYTWEDHRSGEGMGILKSRMEKQFQPLKTEKLRVGAGGVETFHYVATGRGTTRLAFSYGRPWEKSVPPVRRLAWEITVE
jgi:inhibitor of cysteine peptidase